MANKSKIKPGQVWTDSQGREVQIKDSYVSSSGQTRFKVTNLATGRTMDKGARQLKDKVRDADPMSTSRPSRSGGRRRPNPVAPGQEPGYPLESFRDGGYMQPGMTPFKNPGDETGRWDLDPEGVPAWSWAAEQERRREVEEREEKADRTRSMWNLDHPPHEDLIFPPGAARSEDWFYSNNPMRPNPSHYPSEMVQFVCQQLSRMPVAHASIPNLISQAVGRALHQYTSGRR